MTIHKLLSKLKIPINLSTHILVYGLILQIIPSKIIGTAYFWSLFYEITALLF